MRLGQTDDSHGDDAGPNHRPRCTTDGTARFGPLTKRTPPVGVPACAAGRWVRSCGSRGPSLATIGHHSVGPSDVVQDRSSRAHSYRRTSPAITASEETTAMTVPKWLAARVCAPIAQPASSDDHIHQGGSDSDVHRDVAVNRAKRARARWGPAPAGVSLVHKSVRTTGPMTQRCQPDQHHRALSEVGAPHRSRQLPTNPALS